MANYVFNLNDQRSPFCSLWFNPEKFHAPHHRFKELGLCDNQIAFLQTPNLQDRYHGTRTTLYFRYCSFDCPEYIPQTVSMLKKSRYKYEFFELFDEDNPQTAKRKIDDRQFSLMEPLAIATRLPFKTKTETVTVYRTQLGIFRVRYSYDEQGQFDLLNRLAMLNFWDGDVYITNLSIRKMLGIRD